MIIMIKENKKNSFDENFFMSILKTVSQFVEYNDEAELSIVLTDDITIQKLNLEYRKKDHPTDVLSFPIDDEMLGDIVISLDTAERQANEADITLTREVAFLFIHGFLHLLGFDHETSEDDAEEMYDLQEDILKEWEKQNAG